ncbi:MAG: Smr/MutS family protein [Candidatus Acidiferrales bacterium]
MGKTINLHDYSVAEAMAEFVRFYNDCLASRYSGRIEVIHGYGASGKGGAIRRELLKYLKANAENLEQFTDGESIGNPGITIVYPKKPLQLPEIPTSVGSDILAEKALRQLCKSPKSEQKILGKLRGRFGDRVLRTLIRGMVKVGDLEEIKTGNGVLYRAIC